MTRSWKGTWVWSKRFWYFWIVISRLWWHNFQNLTIETSGFRKNSSSSRIRTCWLPGPLIKRWGKGWNFLCNRFLEPIRKIIFTSQLQMFSCLMKLQMFSLLVNCWKSTIQRFQLCVGLNTLYPYFSMTFPKPQLWIRWLQIIRKYITYLVLAYITNLIIYLNQNHMSFTIETLDYSVAMIPEWLIFSLECTEICALENDFCHSLFSLIQNYGSELKTFQSSIIHSG